MTGAFAEILGVLLVIATLALLLTISWDTRDEFASMDRRLAGRDARRAARADRTGRRVPVERAQRPAPAIPAGRAGSR